MSLRTQHDLAELRRQRARSAASPSVGLAHVLRAGFSRLSLTAPTDAGATRGGRLPHEKPAFERDRRYNHSFPSMPISDAGETSTAEVGYRLITPPPTPSVPNLGRPLEARDLWGTEPIGFHGSPPE